MMVVIMIAAMMMMMIRRMRVMMMVLVLVVVVVVSGPVHPKVPRPTQMLRLHESAALPPGCSPLPCHRPHLVLCDTRLRERIS